MKAVNPESLDFNRSPLYSVIFFFLKNYFRQENNLSVIHSEDRDLLEEIRMKRSIKLMADSDQYFYMFFEL